MGKLITGRLRQDEDCHWYLIPDDKIKRFDEITMKMENLDWENEKDSDHLSDLEDELVNCYEEYMLGGGPYKLAIIMDA